MSTLLETKAIEAKVPEPGKPISVSRLSQLFNLLGPFFGLLLVLGLFSLSSEVRPSLFTGGNCKIILIQTVIVAIGALGMTMIIVSGGIDFSGGSMVGFARGVGATLVGRGGFSGLVVAVMVLAGRGV